MLKKWLIGLIRKVETWELLQLLLWIPKYDDQTKVCIELVKKEALMMKKQIKGIPCRYIRFFTHYMREDIKDLYHL